MTINGAITQIDTLKPNQYTTDEKTGWLSDLDGLVYKELVCTHEGVGGEDFAVYGADTDTATVLMIPAPYDEIYVWYLASRIDLHNGEIEKYNNSNAMYNNAYLTYSDYYTRSHTPLRPAEYFKI